MIFIGSRQASVWPPSFDKQSLRLKGFYPHVIAEPKDASLFAIQAQQLSSCVQGPTRVSIRAFIYDGLIEYLKKQPNPFILEADFPADRIFSSCSLIYYSFNRSIRMPHPKNLFAEWDTLAALKAKLSKVSRKSLEDKTQGITISSFSKIDDKSAAEISALFTRFYKYPVGTSPAEIKKLIDGNLVFGAYDKSGKLIAVFMADIGVMPVDTVSITSINFVNVVCESPKLSIDLIPLMGYHVVEASRSHRDLLVFAEARADSRILQSSCIKLGMVHANHNSPGTLIASSLMQDSSSAPGQQYVNKPVWYIPPDHTDL